MPLGPIVSPPDSCALHETFFLGARLDVTVRPGTAPWQKGSLPKIRTNRFFAHFVLVGPPLRLSMGPAKPGMGPLRPGMVS